MHFHQNMMHLDTGRIPKSIKMKLAYVDFQDILKAFLEPKSCFGNQKDESNILIDLYVLIYSHFNCLFSKDLLS